LGPHALDPSDPRIIGENRMFPLTIEGLDGAMRELSR
jgi:uncharacterized protein with von Willebrand factor type A (vWA) domain